MKDGRRIYEQGSNDRTAVLKLPSELLEGNSKGSSPCYITASHEGASPPRYMVQFMQSSDSGYIE